MRKVEIFQGSQIDRDKFKKIKKISLKAFKNFDWWITYKTNYTLKQMSSTVSFQLQTEYLVLGSDWFLLFNVDDNIVRISQWISIDNPKTKLSQSIEMLTVLKELLLKYHDKYFKCSMRHTTSYQIYEKMLNQNLFEELYHRVTLFVCPNTTRIRLYNLNDSSKDSKITFEEYLNSEKAQMHPRDLEYVLHKIEFEVTDEFVEKYDKKEKKYIL